MGGLFIPNPGPRTDPWQQFMQAFAFGQQIRAQREQFAGEAEDRKMRRDYQKAVLQAQEREDKIRQSEFDRNFGLKITDLLGSVSGQPEQTQIPSPMGGMMEGPPGMPSLTHDVNLPGFGPTQVPSLEGVLQQLMAKQRIQNEVPLPGGVGQNLGLPPGLESVDARLLAQLPEQVNLPPGLLPSFPQGGAVPKSVAGIGETVFKEGRQDARAAADRASSERVASTNLAAARENQKLTREQQLLDDYTRDTKDFSIVDDQMGRVREFAQLKTGPGDIGLLYSYMKMLDPTSTVREGEYATAQNSGSVPSRIWGAYNKALEGELLAPETRKQFVQAAETNYKVLQGRRSKVDKDYQQRANRFGVNPNIFGGASPAGGTSAPIIQRNTETGAFRYSTDGGKTWKAGRP